LVSRRGDDVSDPLNAEWQQPIGESHRGRDWREIGAPAAIRQLVKVDQRRPTDSRFPFGQPFAHSDRTTLPE
jgi:hypothetical protein